MADKSQFLVKNLFLKVNHNKFYLKFFFFSFAPIFFILLVINKNKKYLEKKKKIKYKRFAKLLQS